MDVFLTQRYSISYEKEAAVTEWLGQWSLPRPLSHEMLTLAAVTEWLGQWSLPRPLSHEMLTLAAVTEWLGQWSLPRPLSHEMLTLYGHIKIAHQQTIIQQYGERWYPGRWWVGCYIWNSKEGPALPSPLLAVHTKCNSPPIDGQCQIHIILCGTIIASAL